MLCVVPGGVIICACTAAQVAMFPLVLAVAGYAIITINDGGGGGNKK